jgi:hypothetical protein
MRFSHDLDPLSATSVVNHSKYFDTLLCGRCRVDAWQWVIETAPLHVQPTRFDTPLFQVICHRLRSHSRQLFVLLDASDSTCVPNDLVNPVIADRHLIERSFAELRQGGTASHEGDA